MYYRIDAFLQCKCDDSARSFRCYDRVGRGSKPCGRERTVDPMLSGVCVGRGSIQLGLNRTRDLKVKGEVFSCALIRQWELFSNLMYLVIKSISNTHTGIINSQTK